MDLDETQAAALDRSCKRRKEDDVTREMIEGAAPKAVDNVMSQSQSQQQLDRQHERLSGKGRK